MSIEAIGRGLPQRVETAEEIAAVTGADPDFIRNKVGIQSRHILGPGETGLDLAEQAVKDLVSRSDCNLNDIGLLIFVTQTPDQRIPHNAAPLAHRLGMPTTLASFDLSLGCSGFVYGLSTMEAFLEAQGIEQGILVTCDPYSRIMASNDKATNAVFGDAAAACWIRRGSGSTKLKGLDFGTDGSGAGAIQIEAGGGAAPLVSLDIPEGIADFDRDALRLKMNGRDVFNFVNGVIPKSFNNSLEKAGLELGDIDWFALHQGSAFMIQTLAKRSDIPPEKLRMNIAQFGNTVSSTIPLLLSDLMNEQSLAGQRVMISGFGVGLSWATGILEFNV